MDNGDYAFYVSACNDPTTVIDATNNWWGIADSASIEAMIYHHTDYPSLPVVDYVPFADSPFVFGDTTGCCNHDGIRGDFNYDMTLNIGDVNELVDYLFFGGLPSPCTEEGDVDGSSAINVADVSYLVDYLFFSGPASPSCR